MDNRIPISSEEVRNWLELPCDVLSHILLKVGAIDILLGAQSVCSVWRNCSKEPSLFRSIDMRNRWSFDDTDMQKVVREAVDRSSGQLVEFSMQHYGSDDLLAYIADRSGSLRCLRLVSCYQVGDDALIYMVEKAVMLEELEICHCSFSQDTLKTVGKACRLLKSFRLNCRGQRWPCIECDEEALGIAENMSELRHLHLFGNYLTNVGLKAILDACLHLESLDLRQCFNINLEGDLLKSCRDRLIKIRLPNDSTDDYEFDDTIEDGSAELYPGNCNYSDFDYDNPIRYIPDLDFGYDSDAVCRDYEIRYYQDDSD